MTNLNKMTTQEKIKEISFENYLEQAKGEEVKAWVLANLANYLKKYDENRDEIEHILDYLNSDEAPKRLQKMSYVQAKNNSEKWLKAQIKKGKTIEEQEDDIEVFIDFQDGFKFVKLIGKKAFEREGFLMSHCVVGYFDKDDCEIYSLRDKNNNPHATIEVVRRRSSIRQIKGKGNGSIHPLYIEYVLRFLAQIGLTVSTYEMERLGYHQVLPEFFEKNKNQEGLKFLEINKEEIKQFFLYIFSIPKNY